MTSAPDLSNLRIDRDQPSPGLTRALRGALWLAGVALVLSGGLWAWLRRGSAVPVDVVTASLDGGGGGGRGPGAGAGAVIVVANGYVVARTKAAVSAKIPGRLASLAVSEGSEVRKGAVIARLDNADYVAAVEQATAQLASARATLTELAADRDELQREFVRTRDLRAQNPNLVSAQDAEVAERRARQGDARVRAQESRVDAAAAGLRLAQANLENTYIRA